MEGRVLTLPESMVEEIARLPLSQEELEWLISTTSSFCSSSFSSSSSLSSSVMVWSASSQVTRIYVARLSEGEILNESLTRRGVVVGELLDIRSIFAILERRFSILRLLENPKEVAKVIIRKWLAHLSLPDVCLERYLCACSENLGLDADLPCSFNVPVEEMNLESYQRRIKKYKEVINKAIISL